MKKFMLTSVACLQVVVLLAQVPARVKALNPIRGGQQTSDGTAAQESKIKKGRGWLLVSPDNESYPSPFILPVPKGRYLAIPFTPPEK